MDASLSQQLSLAAVGMSAAALFFSLIAAFPGLKYVLAAVRDGTLWFSFFLVLGGGGFWAWRQATSEQAESPVTAQPSLGPAAAFSPPQAGP